MSSFKDRMIKSALLDPKIYEEVEADKESMGQAAIVVILSSVAAGIGAIGTNGFAGLVFVTVAALIGWLVWAFLTFYIGTKLLPEPETKSDYGELLRTIGFASSPGLVRILGIIPWIGTIVFVIGGIWMLVAMVVAVKQALDYKSTLRAVGVCVIGWIIQFVVILLLYRVFGVPLESA